MARLNVLFVCSRNQWRSPTAERIYRNDDRMSVRSRGVSSQAKRRLSAEDVKWADLIFVMENKHRSRIASRHRELLEQVELHVLDVPDDYRYMDPELIDLLQERVEQGLATMLGDRNNRGQGN